MRINKNNNKSLYINKSKIHKFNQLKFSKQINKFYNMSKIFIQKLKKIQ